MNKSKKDNKRKCFGTSEYTDISRVCKACRDYNECGKVSKGMEEARRFAPLGVKPCRYVTSGMFARECREYRGPDRPKISLPPSMLNNSDIDE